MDMDLIYQLIAGGVILVVAVLFMRFIAIVLIAAVIGTGLYYNFMATPGEKEEATVCLKAIPTSFFKLTFPSQCNNMINTIKTKIPNKLEDATTKDINKTKQNIIQKIN